MSDSVTIRLFKPDADFSAYAEFLNTCSRLTGVDAKTSEQEQRDHAELFTINLNEDRFVAESEAGIVGFLDIWRLATNPTAFSSVQVHPDWRRRGIGSRLMEAGVRHARTIGATAVDGYAQREQAAERAFLEKHGFKVAGNFTAMETTLTKPLPQVDLEGHTLKTYSELNMSEEDKLELIFKADQEFWGVLYGHGFSESEDVGKQRLRDLTLGEFSEDAMYFLFDADSYIGHDRVSFGEIAGVKTGYVSVPALHPEYHTPELAKNFALVGLEYLQAQGCTKFKLNAWGESDATLAAFKELGFEVTTFELGYQLKL